MNFDQLKDNWQRFGLLDPLWAISTDPGTENNGWELERFFQVGRDTVAGSMRPVLELCLFQLPDHLSNTATPGPDGAPVMEMYGMSPESVAEIVARHGGTVLRTEENGWAGTYVRRFTYLVAKA